MSQPLHTGPSQIDGNLKAAWLPVRDDHCWACEGTGRQLVHWVADRIYFGAPTDETCDECGGSGRADEPEDPADSDHWLPGIDDVSDHVREGDR